MRGTCNCSRFPDEHPRQHLCGIGFNEFLGEVQHRLIKLGYEPPLWPDPKISDQGDVDEALDVCVQWCAARLDEAKAARPEVAPFVNATMCEGLAKAIERGEIYMRPGPIQVVYPLDEAWNAAIEAAAKIAFDMPLKSSEERHDYRWNDTYKAAALEISNSIKALRRPTPPSPLATYTENRNAKG